VKRREWEGYNIERSKCPFDTKDREETGFREGIGQEVLSKKGKEISSEVVDGVTVANHKRGKGSKKEVAGKGVTGVGRIALGHRKGQP